MVGITSYQVSFDFIVTIIARKSRKKDIPRKGKSSSHVIQRLRDPNRSCMVHSRLSGRGGGEG